MRSIQREYCKRGTAFFPDRIGYGFFRFFPNRVDRMSRNAPHNLLRAVDYEHFNFLNPYEQPVLRVLLKHGELFGRNGDGLTLRGYPLLNNDERPSELSVALRVLARIHVRLFFEQKAHRSAILRMSAERQVQRFVANVPSIFIRAHRTRTPSAIPRRQAKTRTRRRLGFYEGLRRLLRLQVRRERRYRLIQRYGNWGDSYY